MEHAGTYNSMTPPQHAPARGIRTAILACLLAWGPAPALAAESEPPPPPDLEVEANDAGAAKTADAAGRQQNPRQTDQDTPEIFVPTEDISEDLSVRFPVDI